MLAGRNDKKMERLNNVFIRVCLKDGLLDKNFTTRMLTCLDSMN